MPELSRSQVLVYGAIGVALLLVGVRWIRAADSERATGGLAEVSAPEPREGSFSVSHQAGDLVIHVAGAVREPGVYRLPAGARVTDAVERAGGPTGEALADAINLAAPLADGQQVVLPARVGAAAAASSAAPGDAGPISLGAATVEELDTIEGIGPVTAEQIIAFRDQRGGLASIDELDQISGIGPTTMESWGGRRQP